MFYQDLALFGKEIRIKTNIFIDPSLKSDSYCFVKDDLELTVLGIYKIPYSCGALDRQDSLCLSIAKITTDI